ncbi:23S rRNA (uracil(1939)-C(5))-methyltransferase RlmD [bacterium]|nr:23S rRNA (uracil(1939)-C(5))-methyltransferase RlmD [bacterium]
MKIGDIKEVKIEKLLYEGVGLAHVENLAVFVEHACDEDLLKIEITSINKNFARAKIIEILEPSQYRNKTSFCAMANVCGGCQWSYIDYEHQLDVKQQIIQEALNRVLPDGVKVLPTIRNDEIKNFRHKIQLPVSQTKNSKRFLIGYFKPQSHEIVNIKHCEIQPVILDEIIEFIRINAKEIGINAYNEKTHKGLLRHVILKVSKNDNQILLIFVLNSEKIDKKITELSQKIKEKYKNIVGVCANFNTQKTNVILGKITQTITGQSFYSEKLGNKTYQISAQSFFQTNPSMAEKILDVIKNDINKNFDKPTILDAYSGVSTFGIYLSDIASKIICCESEKSSCEDAKNSLKINNIKNIEIINADATKTFAQFIKDKKQFDIAIIDPPRKGSTEAGLNDLIKMTKKTIYYVSCNPQTLARDAKILKSLGFEIEFAQGADMFPHSYHIETIAKFNRQ